MPDSAVRAVFQVSDLYNRRGGATVPPCPPFAEDIPAH